MNRPVALSLLAVAVIGCGSGASVRGGSDAPPVATGALSIALTPSTVTIPRSGRATIQVDLTRMNFPNAVTLTVEGLSAAGISSAGAQIDASANTASIVLVASTTALVGTTRGTVNANAGAATATLTATVVAAPFTVELSRPELTIAPGGTASQVVSVPRAAGFAEAITIVAAGLPPGVTADPLTLAGTDAFGLLTFRSDGSGSAVSGVPVTVTGTSGEHSASTTFALTLPGLAIFVLPPALILGQGEAGGVILDTASLASVAGAKIVTVAGLVRGVHADALQIPDGESVGVLQLAADTDVEPGSFALTVTATVGTTSASAALSLTVERNTVQIASLDPPSLTLAAGTSRRVVVEVVRTGTFRIVAMPISASGLPAGVTADPLLVPTESSSGVLVLRAAPDVALGGPFAVSVTAGIAPLASAPLALTLGAPFDFSFVADSVSLGQGLAAFPAFTLTRNAGFGGSVDVEVNALPDGVVARGRTLPPGSTSAEIDLGATSAAVAGRSAISVTATGGGFSTTRALPLDVFVPDAGSPRITSFAASDVFVGDRARLTAVFTGDAASIDGIGAVQSGQLVDTPPLAQISTFTLRVRRGTEQVDAHVLVVPNYRNRFRELAAAPVGRGVHLAATLPGGGALLMGGHTSDALNVPSNITTQRYDEATERTLPGPDLPFTVNTPETSVVQLVDGGFLLVGGGINSNTFGLGADAQRVTLAFDATNQQFVRVGNTQERRSGSRVVTALLDGGALLTGGSFGFSPLQTAERFDASTQHWSSVGLMGVGRLGHTATRLADGHVLVVGGLTCCRITPDTVSLFSTDTAEMYDPETDQFSPTGSLTAARSFHTATLLPDGRVLVAGGLFGDDANSAPAEAEIYDPSTGEFSAAGALSAARGFHSAVLLGDGRVLVLGGSNEAQLFVGLGTTEIYDPAANVFRPGPLLQPAWIESTVTLLRNGKVLVFGGEDPSTDPVATVMLFE